MNFCELGLRQPLLAALEGLGFETPTPIQQQAIPVLLNGENDFIGLAQTGTGKTGAFGLPMLHKLIPMDRRVQGLIICPTRELCIQVTKDLQKFAGKMREVQVTPVYGGAGIVGQIHELKRGSQIVVATPGRLRDLIGRKAVDLSSVTCAVFDEADEMLNMGFQEDIDAILETVARHAKIWLFSATMSKEVARIASKYQSNPVEVTIGARNLGAENISHHYYIMQEKFRYPALRRILDATPGIFGLVFCRTRIDTQQVAEKLIHHGYLAESIHGELSQAQRDYVMRKFRQKRINILVATDVAARGLDVDDITHVINYSLPDDPLVYTHRSGRTARAGKSGRSIVLISPREQFRIRTLERISKVRFEKCKIPNGETVCRNQVNSFVDKMVKSPAGHQDIEQHLPKVYDAFADFSKEELIDLFISREFGSLLESYRNAPDIDASRQPKQQKEYNQRQQKTKGKGGRGRFPKEGFKKGRRNFGPAQRFFISIGELDNINKGAIVRLVCDKANIRSQMIGEIDVKREFSFFDVADQAADRVRSSMRNMKFDGKPVMVQPSKGKFRKQQSKSKRARG